METEQPQPTDTLFLNYDRTLYKTGASGDSPIMDILQAEPNANNSTAVSVGSANIDSGIGGSTTSQASGSLQSGKKLFDNSVAGYILGIDPNSNGVAKFYIGNQTNYLNWDGVNLTVTGNVAISSLNIPDLVTASSFHVDNTGNAWWGATTLVGAVASVLATGVASFSNANITGGSVATSTLNVAVMGWTSDIIFTSASATQINWSSGHIITTGGTTYNISAGNTGTMLALTYIYLDIAVSITVLQTTTTYSTATANGKILIATAQNNAVSASVIPMGGGQPIIDGSLIGALSIAAAQVANATITGAKIAAATIAAGNIVANTITSSQIAANTITASQIAANTITASQIAAGTITATQMTISQLSAITADLGSITAGTIVLPSGGYIRSGQTAYDTGTGFYIGNVSSTPKLSVGNSAGNKMTWDGTTLAIVGKFTATNGSYLTAFTAGESITQGDAISFGFYISDGGPTLDFDLEGTCSGAGTITVGLTIAAQSNRFIIVVIGTNTNNSSPASASIDAVAMTLQSDGNLSMGNQGTAAVFTLVAPHTGSVNLTFTLPNTLNAYYYKVYNYYNCKQTSQPDVFMDNQGYNGFTASVTPTVDGAVVWALLIGTGGSTMTDLPFHVLTTNCDCSDSGIVYPKQSAGASISHTGQWLAGAAMSIAPYTAPVSAVVRASSANTNVSTYYSYTKFRLNFCGFADASASANTSVNVTTLGIATGLSGLAQMGQYYLANTVGTVSTTPGTNTRKCGIAFSTTTMLITNIW